MESESKFNFNQYSMFQISVKWFKGPYGNFFWKFTRFQKKMQIISKIDLNGLEIKNKTWKNVQNYKLYNIPCFSSSKNGFINFFHVKYLFFSNKNLVIFNIRIFKALCNMEKFKLGIKHVFDQFSMFFLFIFNVSRLILKISENLILKFSEKWWR